MERVSFDDAETYEPDAGWRRVALAGDDEVSLEWFQKPPGHSSPMHDHQNGQVCLVLDGELTVHTEDASERLEFDRPFHCTETTLLPPVQTVLAPREGRRTRRAPGGHR